MRSTLAVTLAAVTLGVAIPAAAQTQAEESRFQQAQQRFQTEQQRFQNEWTLFRQEYDRYQAARAARRDPRDDPRYDPRDDQRNDPRYDQRNDPRYDQRGDPRDNSDDRYEGGYDAARYYRDGSGYQERTLAADDRVYRGSDGRYYCKRSDGTTGLIIGAVGGGVLGNVIDGGHSRVVGTLLGGALGAFAGKAIDQRRSEIKCR